VNGSQIRKCAFCGSPGEVQRSDGRVAIAPKQLEKCKLYQDAREGSLAYFCATAACPNREIAVREWNAMQGATETA
jgi:hypothetical protein